MGDLQHFGSNWPQRGNLRRHCDKHSMRSTETEKKIIIS